MSINFTTPGSFAQVFSSFQIHLNPDMYEHFYCAPFHECKYIKAVVKETAF